MTHADQQTIRTIATAGADAIARWRRSKQTSRASHYRRRMEGNRAKLAQLAVPAWLAAVDRDDRTDPAEHELLLEERAA